MAGLLPDDQMGLIMGLLSARQGDNLGLLFQQHANQQSQNAQRKQQMDMQAMQMAEMKRQQEQAGQMRGLAQRAFAPGQEGQGPMPDGQSPLMTGQGGGLPEYARGMMQIDPMQGMQLQHQVAEMYKPPAPIKIGKSDRLVDPKTYKPLVEALPDLPTGMVMGPNGQPQYDPAYLKGQQQIRAAGKTNVTTNVMPPREVFKDSMALKKDFDSQPEVKGFKEVQGAWDQIRTALDEPSAANDLAAATKFMKLLDPGSVVRESELAMAMQASGALDRFSNYANRIKTGQKLTPTQRQDFRQAGEALYNASKNRFGETVQQYQGIAGQYNLDSQFIPKQSAAPKNLSKNTTATYKAKEAIKRGADPEAVKQRLIEQGYDASGL